MRIWEDLAADSKIFQGGSLTLGNFDGLHVGHQALIRALEEEPGPRVVMTFRPHPVQVLFPEKPFKRLLPEEDLASRLKDFNVDLLLRLPFTKALSQKSAEDFFREKILRPFQPKVVVAGYDFALGQGRHGDISWLQEFSKGKFQVRQVPAVMEDGKPISSRRLREAVEKGDVVLARKWLGRPFYVQGPVVKGAGRGRTLNIPTLNQKIVAETCPAPGVYVTQVRQGNVTLPSVTNIGRAPTFEVAAETRIETHILDRSVDLYGQTVVVEFLKRIRDEMKFSSAESLKKQIEQDILVARGEFH